MTTVYILTLAMDYEGETILGAYETVEDAYAAGDAFLVDRERELASYEEFRVHSVVVGATADYRF